MAKKPRQHGGRVTERPSRAHNPDPWQEPTAKTWVRHVLENMAPKMHDSTMVLSLVPENREGDVKFWVELGASIMMDKPIIAVLFDDQPLSGKLAAVADEVVRLPRGVTPEASQDLIAAIARIHQKFSEEGPND